MKKILYLPDKTAKLSKKMTRHPLSTNVKLRPLCGILYVNEFMLYD